MLLRNDQEEVLLLEKSPVQTKVGNNKEKKLKITQIRVAGLLDSIFYVDMVSMLNLLDDTYIYVSNHSRVCTLHPPSTDVRVKCR